MTAKRELLSQAELTTLALNHAAWLARLTATELPEEQDEDAIKPARLSIKRRKLSMVALAGLDLKLAVIEDCEFVDCDLFGTSLVGATMTGCVISDSCLSHADLTRANLTGAKITDSDLSDVILEGALLLGADFGGSKMHGAKIRDILLRETSMWFQAGRFASMMPSEPSLEGCLC